jgi:hypothetical protein
MEKKVYLDSKGLVRYTYARVCVECGDVSFVKYIPKGDCKCQSCSAKERVSALHEFNKKPDDKKGYLRICPHCGDEKRIKRNPKEDQLCGDCSRKHSGVLRRKHPVKEKVAKRVFVEKNPKKALITPKKTMTIGKRSISIAAIEREKRLNAEHRARMQEIHSSPETPKQRKTDEELKAEWLQKNKPKVFDVAEDRYTTSCQLYIANSLY